MEPRQNQPLLEKEIYYWSLMAAILVLATLYRFHDIDRLSLWADELWGVIACSQDSLMGMIGELITRDNHPPGYQTILYFVMKWFGNSEVAIRAPSALAGIFAVAAVYQMGKIFFTREAGIIAALLLAGSYQHIVYSQEARAYTLLALVFLLNLYFFARLFIFEEISNKNTILFAATGVICLYLHYAGILLLGCELFVGSILFSEVKNKKGLFVAALYGFGIMFLLFFRWIPVMIAHMNINEFYWAKTPTVNSLIETSVFLLGPDGLRISWQLLVLIAGLLLVIRGIWRDTRENYAEIKWIATLSVLILMPISLVFIKSVVSPSIYTQRYFVFTIPLLCLLVGYSLDKLIREFGAAGVKKYLFLGALAAISINQVVYNQSVYTKTFDKQDFRGATQQVAREISLSGQRPMIIASHEFFDFYLKKYQVSEKADYYLVFPEHVAEAISTIEAADPDTFYYLEVSLEDETPISLTLNARYKAIGKQRFDGINIRKYQREGRTRPTRQMTQITGNSYFSGSELM